MRNNFSLLIVEVFIDNKWFDPRGSGIYKIDILSSYKILNIKASNFSIVSYLKCFETALFEFPVF